MPNNSSGFTLLELMIGLSIAALLSLIAVPSLSHYLAKQRIAAQTYSIWRLLTKTRELAVNSGRRTSLCGLNKNKQCSRHNIQAFVIYQDKNHNKTLDDADTRFEYLALGNTNIQLSHNSKTIAYDGNGYARQPGGIIVCPLEPDPTLISKVTVNRAGRTYLAPDRNHDGRVENYDGSIIEC